MIHQLQFIFFMPLFWSLHSNASTEFAPMYKKSQRASVSQQVQFYKVIGDHLQKLENKKNKSAIWIPSFIERSYAAEKSWCVNNGFLSEVENCSAANNWSFATEGLPEVQLLNQANIHFQCPEGAHPCSMVAGISADGTGYCSQNSTRQCMNQGEADGGVQRLVNALNQCRQGRASVAIGSRQVLCAPLEESLSRQIAVLDSNCRTAQRELRRLCESTKSQLNRILSHRSEQTEMQTQAPTQETTASSISSALFIGDSHSYGCFGETLQKGLEQRAGSVRAVATCGSSASSWLRPNHSTSCGLRSCHNSQCSQSTRGQSEGLQSLLSHSRPQVTVLALGSNMLKSNWSATEADVIALIRQTKAAGSRCIWIGPPQASTRFMSVNQYNLFVSRLQETVTTNGCEFIDSSTRTDRANTEGDSMGLHYGCGSATSWANSINSTLSALLGTPTASPQDAEESPTSL